MRSSKIFHYKTKIYQEIKNGNEKGDATQVDTCMDEKFINQEKLHTENLVEENGGKNEVEETAKDSGADSTSEKEGSNQMETEEVSSDEDNDLRKDNKHSEDITEYDEENHKHNDKNFEEEKVVSIAF